MPSAHHVNLSRLHTSMQALETEALRKELEGARAAAAQLEADLKKELEVQQRLTEDAQQQVQALRHELDILQVYHLMHPTQQRAL